MSCHTQYTDVEPPYDTEESFGSDPACMSQMISVASLPSSITHLAPRLQIQTLVHNRVDDPCDPRCTLLYNPPTLLDGHED